MAWNQPGKGKRDPWNGKDPRSEVDAFVNRIKGMFGGGRGGSSRGGGDSGFGFGPLVWIAVVVAIWLVFNSFQLLDERQRGVVLRFGQFDRIMEPGPNFKWPWPIERVYKVEATQVKTVSDQVRVLAKDENIVQIDFNVQYLISDPRQFLFGGRDPEDTLKQAAESAVREVAGTNVMDTILYERGKLTVEARQKLQVSLDDYRTGLQVTDFNLQDARPPAEVKEAFDDAISAREDRERAENEAQAYASKVVPEARGAAARLLEEAAGYKASITARAEGDAQRFGNLAAEYRKAPEVTRKRLYLETMQQVLARNPKVVAGSENNILYLPIDGASTRAPGANAPATSLPAAAAAALEIDHNGIRPERASRPDDRSSDSRQEARR